MNTHAKDIRVLPDNKVFKIIKHGNFTKYKCLFGAAGIREHIMTHAFKEVKIKGNCSPLGKTIKLVRNKIL